MIANKAYVGPRQTPYDLTPSRSRPHVGWLTIALVALLTLSGCASSTAGPSDEPTEQQQAYDKANILPADKATVVAYPEQDYNDPLIGFNRAVFAFNDVSYRYVLIPVAKAYKFAVPDPVRGSVGNFFTNIKSPISIVNHLLQGEGKRAGNTSLRFLINTTVGIVGLFDPAADWWDLEPTPTGFADTLEKHGSGRGAYIVLPFLGPSDLRGGAGLIADYFLNPVPYLTEQPDTAIITATDATQDFADKADKYPTLRDNSDDPYLFFRNMYLQGEMRDSQFPDISGRQGQQRRDQHRQSSEQQSQHEAE